jgi:hypothetical protein
MVSVGGTFQAISPGMAKTEFVSRMWADEPERADEVFSRYKVIWNRSLYVL